MTRRTRRLLLSVLAGAACLPLAPAGAAPRRTPIRPFSVTDFGGEIYVRGQMRDKTETTSGQKLTETDNFFEESVLLRAKGYAYHPNLLDWFASVRLGLSQQEIIINNDSFGFDGRLRDYNLSGLFLKEKRVSMHAFASASRNMTNRDFASALELEQSRRGVEFLLRGGFPASLLIEEVKLTETSDQTTDDQRTRHLRFSIADRRDPDHFTEFIYDREVTDETTTFTSGTSSSTQELPATIDELTLTTLQRFGPEAHPHRFSGQLRRLDRTGFYLDKLTTADGTLELNHTKTFSTRYHGFYSREQTLDEMERIVNGEVGFAKRFYESLDVTGRLTANDQTFVDGSEKIRGAFIDLDYRKRTPIGRYSSFLELGRECEKDTGGSAFRSIRDEQVTLNDETYVQLAQPNVDTATIEVTNLDHTQTFVLNTDYVLRTTGAFTEIARVAASVGIGDGDTVSVTYRARVGGNYEYRTDHFTWNNRLDFKQVPFSVYYNHSLRDEQLTAGADPGNLDTLTIDLFGVQLNTHGLIVSYEHEARDQQLYPPSDADRVEARYNCRVGRDTDLSVGGRAERLVYRQAQQFGLEPGRDYLDSLSAYGNLVSKLRRNVLLRMSADYYRTRGRENNETTRLIGGLEWNYRKLEMSVEARQTFYTREETTGSEQGLFFTLRRRF